MGALQLVGTANGIEIIGPGGRTILTNRMVAQLAEFTVALLDVLQADPDLEPNGDELDGTMGEDDFCYHSPASEWGAAGCAISDSGRGNVDDGGERDPSDEGEQEDSY